MISLFVRTLADSAIRIGCFGFVYGYNQIGRIKLRLKLKFIKSVK